MANLIVFDKLVTDASRHGVLLDKSKESNTWLRNRAAGVANSSVTAAKMLTEKTRLKSFVVPGNCYMFTYDPKTKATLPFYDKFPVIFPFRKVPGGFYGINLHYLPLRQRALLLDALESNVLSNKSYDDTTKLRINYKLLCSAARYRYFAPCVKHYLDNHVTSRFIYIHPSEWQMALFLPTQKFVGATTQQVWKDSRGKW